MKKKIIDEIMKIKEKGNEKAVAIGTFVMGMFVYAVPVMAEEDSLSVNSVTNSIYNLYTLLLYIFGALGAIFIAYGLYEIAMSYFQQDPGARSRAIPHVVAGLIMVSIGTIVTLIRG